MQIFGHGPGDTDAVEGRRAASYFVEQHEAVVGGVVEDIGHLDHLHQKRALAARQPVGRAHARVEFVNNADVGRAAGTNDPICAMMAMSAFWRKYVDLPAMFGPGNEQNLAVGGPQVGVVGNELVARGSCAPPPDAVRL